MFPGATVFPEGLAIGSSFDMPLVESIYAASAQEARATGIHVLSTLVLELDRDPRMGRNEEAYTEDTYLDSRIAEAIVRGAQGPRTEAVRLIFDAYTRQGLSLGAIAGLLNQREVPTRTRQSRWERPTLWRMLHNPAYAGHAFYGKTELRPRQRITRRLRQRGLCSGGVAGDYAAAGRSQLAVPALVSEATFALAQEQFEKNKRFSPRRTIEPSLLQGLLVCQRCGYGLYRAGYSGGLMPVLVLVELCRLKGAFRSSRRWPGPRRPRRTLRLIYPRFPRRCLTLK